MIAKKLVEKIPDILLAQLAGFSLVYGLTSSLNLTYPLVKILLLVMLCITVLFVSFYNKKTSLAAYILLGAASFAGLMYIAFETGINKVLTFFDGYFYWLGDYIRYSGAIDPLYQYITVLSLCILLSVFSYIFIIRKFMFFIIVGAGMGLFTVQWSYNFITSLVPFYIFLLITLIFYLKHVYNQKTSKAPNEFAKSGMMIIWSLPVCIIIIAVASLIHASNKPIEWKWLDKKIVSVYNYINRNMDYEAFDYFSLSASSGFGDKNNILGGRVKLDRTNVLKVTSNKNVYLKGISKDIYTGISWTNSIPEKTAIGTNYSVVYSDTDEMLQGMRILTGKDDFLEEYFDINKVSVTFLNLKTKSLFIPSKPITFKPKKDSFTGFINNTGDLSTVQRLTKGFNYTLDIYSPKIGTEEFANAMRESKKGLYSDYLLKTEFPTYFESLSFKQPITEKNITISADTSVAAISILVTNDTLAEINKELSQLKKNSEQIYNKYLQLPQNLPQRVKDLSASLTASGKTDYDKAKAIEQYLSSNYPYNLDVRSTPRNRDFVDYFLFDLKQGYCSYYASAMTILARCAGLPARYVEGYILPPEPIKDSSSTYVVTNMQAHAWVEIYFEGYGWLPFEPTSPFRANFYTNETSSAVYASSYNSAYEDYMEMIKRYTNNDETNITIGDYEVQERISDVFIMLIVAGAVILILIALLLFNIIRNRFKLYKLVNLPAKECILRLYNYYVSVLCLQGLDFKPSETPFQYCDRIDSFMFFSPVKFKVITDIFVKSRYSLKEANEKEKQLFCDFHPGFLEEVRVNMGKFKYFVFKYILGKF